MRAAGVRTVVWVTPWVNLDSRRRPAAARPGVGAPAPPPGLQLRRGHVGRPLPPRAERRPARRHAGGWGSARRSTSPRRRRAAGGRSRRGAVLEMGVEGIKADDGEGYFIPPEARFADRRTGRRGGLGLRRPLPAHDAGGRSTRSIPGPGCCSAAAAGAASRRSGSPGAATRSRTSGRCGPWSSRRLTAAASGFSNWSHDVGGYLGKRLVERCPRELLLRWVQFGCFTPADAGPRALRAGGVALRRPHARRLPRATSSCTSASSPTSAPRRRPPPAPGCRSSGRWRSSIPATSAAGRSPTATRSGPRSGSPRCSSRARPSAAPTCRGRRWIEFDPDPRRRGDRSSGSTAAVSWSSTPRASGSRSGSGAGAIVVTYPAEHVATGLGDTARGRAAPRSDALGRARAAGGPRRVLADGTADPLGARRVVGRPAARGRVSGSCATAA